MKATEWEHQQIVDPINLEVVHKFELDITLTIAK